MIPHPDRKASLVAPRVLVLALVLTVVLLAANAAIPGPWWGMIPAAALWCTHQILRARPVPFSLSLLLSPEVIAICVFPQPAFIAVCMLVFLLRQIVLRHANFAHTQQQPMVRTRTQLRAALGLQRQSLPHRTQALTGVAVLTVGIVHIIPAAWSWGWNPAVFPAALFAMAFASMLTFDLNSVKGLSTPTAGN